MKEYLTEKELEIFGTFLEKKKISKAELARKLGKKPATAFYWFKKKKMKRLIAREFIKNERENALGDFEEVDKI